eukprot:353044-Chlamydomonas_euryale.AAC.3
MRVAARPGGEGRAVLLWCWDAPPAPGVCQPPLAIARPRLCPHPPDRARIATHRSSRSRPRQPRRRLQRRWEVPRMQRARASHRLAPPRRPSGRFCAASSVTCLHGVSSVASATAAATATATATAAANASPQPRLRVAGL